MDSDRKADTLTLLDRLHLLESTGVITATARRLTERAILDIEAFTGAALEDEAGGQLVTHLAMALTRVDRGEPAPHLPDIVTNEIADRVVEQRAVEAMLGDWQQALGRPLPDPEVSYLVLHLAALRVKASSSP